MTTVESENGVASQYVPFTPFQESYAFQAEPSTLELLEQSDAVLRATPFVSEYAGAEESAPQAEEFSALLYELYDEEFDDLLADIAHEAWEAVNQRAEPFGEMSAPDTAEQFLLEWSEPVRRAAEAMFDNMAQAISEHDLEVMSETEIDDFFERFEPRGTGLEPYFENFLGKLVSKAKTLATKALAVAKKGLTLLPGLSGLISKLKALVRPLLDRVLKTAIDKLPPTLRPLARQLAQRVLGGSAGEVESEAFEAAPASPDVAALQQQFDVQAATLMFAGDEIDQEVVLNEAATAAERSDGGTVATLDEARARFVDNLEAGVDPKQAIEQFIPAVMAVLPIARTVIGVIGRKRVVDMLANVLAGFIARYVPKDASTQLSKAIVDAGLRMLTLEAPLESGAGGSRLAYETIAQTVEDTVRRVSQFHEGVFEDSVVLEAGVVDSFQQAAAENFPPEIIVSELHETPLGATWVLMPADRRRKHYKKYGRIFDVEISSQVAESLTTFGGTKISTFLKQQLGVEPPVRARVHLYQAITGTTLGRIARLETNVSGLGSAPHGAVQLHPLTARAAGTLLQQPKLGRDVPGAFRSTRRAIAVGARFYYLEIAGTRLITAAAGGVGQGRVNRTTDVKVALDFRKDEFRIFIFLGESDAQQIAAKIRKQDLTSVLVLAKRIYEPGLRAALCGSMRRRVKILTETMPQDEFFGGPLGKLPEELKQRLAQRVSDWVGTAIAEYMRAGAGEFISASEDPADGVSIIIHAKSPPGAPLVRKLLRGESIGQVALSDRDSLFKGQPQLSVKTVAGSRFG